MDSWPFLQDQIKSFTQNSELNKLPEFSNIAIFDPPLVGVASPIDSLWGELKEPEVVGKGHLSPQDWLADAKSVIVYFLPFSKQIREANRVEGLPALEWVYGRIEGEEFNRALRQHIVDAIQQLGCRAIAPALSERLKTIERRSNWSERHAAFISGLGTFGLSRSLITSKGSAGRIGSVVANLDLTPTPRKYQRVYEYCTWVEKQECGDCIDRCPSNAITPKEKQTAICSNYLKNVTKVKFAPRYGCGKCQTAVACESSIP